MLATGLAAVVRADGSSVRLVRLAGGESDGADAATFTLVQGVRSTGQAVDMSDRDLDGDDTDLTIVEAPSGALLADARRRYPGAVVLITRPGQADDVTINRWVSEHAPAAIVLNSVNPQQPGSAGIKVPSYGVETIGSIPQDRLLSAPSVRAIAEAVQGDLTGSAERQAEAVTWLQIGPISAHGGTEHFGRYEDKAVVTRHDKIDVALSALDSEPACLILSGGEPNLPYVRQRAESEDFALIVTSLSTPDVTTRIGELYAHSPFRGHRKVERAEALVREHVDLSALQRIIAS
jgi:hypothetical protein